MLSFKIEWKNIAKTAIFRPTPTFSEKDLVNHFKGEWREVRRYILDAVRDGVTHHPDNKLKEYMDFGGQRKRTAVFV